MASINTSSMNPIMEVALHNGEATVGSSSALVVGKDYILVFRHDDSTLAARTVRATAKKVDNDICLGNYHLVDALKEDTTEDFCYIYKPNGKVVCKDTNESVSDYVWVCKPVETENTFVVEGIDRLFVKAPGGKVFQIVVDDMGALSTKEAI